MKTFEQHCKEIYEESCYDHTIRLLPRHYYVDAVEVEAKRRMKQELEEVTRKEMELEAKYRKGEKALDEAWEKSTW